MCVDHPLEQQKYGQKQRTRILSCRQKEAQNEAITVKLFEYVNEGGRLEE